MKSIIVTGTPYAHVPGRLVIPDGVEDAKVYLKEHRDEIDWDYDKVEFDFAGTDIDIDEIQSFEKKPGETYISISARTLMEGLEKEYEGKDMEIGKACSFIHYLCQYLLNFEYEESEELSCLASQVGYDIESGLYLDDDEDPLVGEDEVNKLRELLYQKASEVNPEAIFDLAQHIEQYENVIETALIAATEDERTRFKNVLLTLMKFFEEHNAPGDAKKALLEQSAWYDQFKPKQCEAIRNIMANYMFKVDKELFGQQSNTSWTAGSPVTQWDVCEDKALNDYAYVAHINRHMNGGFLSTSDIAILFKCDDSMVSQVELKLYRRCLSGNGCTVDGGMFVGDITKFGVDLEKADEAQSKICSELNKAILKVKKLIEEHPEADKLIYEIEKENIPSYKF